MIILRKILRKAAGVSLWPDLRLLSVRFVAPRTLGLTKPSRILVYAYSGIGNLILYTPALRALRQLFPGAVIELLVGNGTGSEEVVQEGDLVDRVLEVRASSPVWGKVKFAFQIRRAGYDIVISEFHNNSWYHAMWTLASGAPLRVGHVTSPGWANKWDWVYNVKVPMEENQHEIDRYLDLIKVLGLTGEVDRQPTVAVGEADRRFAEAFLGAHSHNGEAKVAVQIGTSPSMRWKQWPLKHFAELCEALHREGVQIILVGSPGERELVEQFAEQLCFTPLMAAGRTTVRQLAALLELCDVLVCNDSGPMHVAVAVGTPVVAIYGPTDPWRTAPLGPQHTIVRKDLPCSPCFRMDGPARVEACKERQCLEDITVGDVFPEVMRKLGLYSWGTLN